MDFHMKFNCIEIVYRTCSMTYITVSNFEKLSQQTGKNLDKKIEECKSDISSTQLKW